MSASTEQSPSADVFVSYAPDKRMQSAGLTYGNPLCVDGAQIGVLKQVHHEVLSGLRRSKQASMARY